MRPDWYVIANGLDVARSAIREEISENLERIVRRLRRRVPSLDPLRAWWRRNECAIARAMGMPFI